MFILVLFSHLLLFSEASAAGPLKRGERLRWRDAAGASSVYKFANTSSIATTPSSSQDFITTSISDTLSASSTTTIPSSSSTGSDLAGSTTSTSISQSFTLIEILRQVRHRYLWRTNQSPVD
ncbi:hypothetical protein GGR54DRAFT_225732 [Hypoxylon sp. NC1633]|nr:hypothetical protein GGR54DRAFT_225732 [Hypoxylon sp. NC1633]